jgi:hypothetical protein
MPDGVYVDMKLSEIDGLLFVSGLAGFHLINIQRWTNGWRIIYHAPKKAGRRPKLEECRDDIDYHYMLSSWLSRGRVYSKWNEDLGELVKSETKRMEALLPDG